MKLRTKAISLLLAAGMVLPLGAPAAAADVPAYAVPISVDESVYVNLDHYGRVSDASVVKGCSLNGNRTFTDYGSYSNVSNMSGYDQPELTGQGVTWNLPADAKERFYYECALHDANLVLPWTFQVTYKLNGVPKQAEELAGASGLVEINVACTPNPDASEYYRNNILLQVASMVNMDEVLSVEAPGSQTQAVGTYKAIIFAALPGEQATFTIRIGTEHFSTMGLVMLMIPGTLSQMEQLKQLKQSKELLGDSASLLFAGMNDILRTVNGMSGSLQLTQKGLLAFQEAQAAANANGNDLGGNLDAVLANLSELSQQMVNMVPYLQDGQKLVDVLYENGSGLLGSSTQISGTLSTVTRQISTLQSALEKLRTEGAGTTPEALDQLQQGLAGLSSNLTDILEKVHQAQQDAANGNSPIQPLYDLAGRMEDALKSFEDNYGSLPGVQDSINNLKQSVASFRTTLDRLSAAYDEMLTQIEHVSTNLRLVVDATNELSQNVERLLFNGDLDAALQNIGQMMGTIETAIGQCQTVIAQLNALGKELSAYQEKIKSLLSDAATLTTRLTGTLDSTTAVLQSVRTTLQTSSGSLQTGTQNTLDGLTQALEQAIGGTQNTQNLAGASSSLQTTLDKIMNQYTAGNNLLEIDANRQFVSFTSERNPTPQSIQVILRTAEIGLGGEADDLGINGNEESGSPWSRIANIFKKIWQAIRSIFE